MKMLTRLTSGLLSIAMVLSAAGNSPLIFQNRQFTAVASESNYGDTEYVAEIRDVYIKSLKDEKNRKTITIIPKTGGIYNFYNEVVISLESPESAGISLEDEDRDEVIKWKNSCKLFEQLEEEAVVTLKLAAYAKEDFDAFNEVIEKQSIYRDFSHDYLYMDYIASIRSSSIHYYGDINDDGVVDSFDVIIYRKQLSGDKNTKLTDDQFGNGDINNNAEIDEEDLKQVQDYLLGKTKEFNGCAAIGSVRLDNTIDVKADSGKTTDDVFAAAEMKFGIDLLKKCFDPTVSGEENMLISPLSVSTALAMTANGADGETRAEMEKVLGNGLTLDEINDYMAYYLSNLPDEKKTKVYLADSVWFKDKPEFKVYDDFLEKNKRFYNAQIYKAPFDDTTVSDVNSWVNQNTKGMIPSLLKNGDLDPDEQKEILMMLINTVYFEAEWMDTYERSLDGKFTDLNGKEHNIKELRSMEKEYFDLGDADAFKKDYFGGKYSFVGIMPKEKSLVEYINDLDAEKLYNGLRACEDPDTVDLYVMIPKFKYNYSKSLSDVLKAIGMPSAFDYKTADFSKINDMSFEEAPQLFIDDVLHKTKIEVTEKGTKAAAVTAVMMAAMSAMPIPKKEVHIELDKPFMYMIVDENNMPLFIGAATQLEEN